MTRSDRDQVGAFLDALQTSPRGRVAAANILDALEEGLVTEDLLKEFLLECAEMFSNNSVSMVDAPDVVDDVSCGQGPKGRNYLRNCKQPQFSSSDRYRLSNTLKTESLNRFILADAYKGGSRGMTVVLPLKPVNSPSGERDYKQRLAWVTSQGDWISPQASLGRPLPSPENCWLSTDKFGLETDGPDYGGDIATQTRDQLGLINIGIGCFLLRIHFRCSSLEKIPGCEVARPVFSDRGNSRFRVRQVSAHAQVYASEGWGATVHLGKLAHAIFADLTGVGERVSSSLPVSELDDLEVEYLGAIGSQRGGSKNDNDQAFVAIVEDGREAEYIRNRVVAIFN